METERQTKIVVALHACHCRCQMGSCGSLTVTSAGWQHRLNHRN